MSKPDVSVIIPVYNRESVIERSVNSVLEQTYEHLELIVVDDGSDDGTLNRLLSYSDERMRVLRQSSNQGANAARNRGLRAAEGKYIAFQDSDDRWYPEKLEKQVYRMKTSPDRVGIVYSAYWNVQSTFSSYLPQQIPPKMSGDLSRVLLQFNIVGFPNTLIDTRVFRKTGTLDRKLPALQDWDFHLNASQYTHYHFMAKPLMDRYPQESSISGNYEKLVRAHRRLMKKHDPRFRRQPEALSKMQFRLGSSLVLTSHTDEGREWISSALNVAPENPVYRLAHFISYLGPHVFEFCWNVRSQFIALADFIRFHSNNLFFYENSSRKGLNF